MEAEDLANAIKQWARDYREAICFCQQDQMDVGEDSLFNMLWKLEDCIDDAMDKTEQSKTIPWFGSGWECWWPAQSKRDQPLK